MTSVSILWENLPFGNKVFSIKHADSMSDGMRNGKDSLVVINDDESINSSENFYLMTERVRERRNFQGLGIAVDELPCIDDGDVVLYDGANKRLEVIFQVKSSTNSLYVTNACNSSCRFCPQPSTADDGFLFKVAEEVVNLVDDIGTVVNISGGEPTLARKQFVNLLSVAQEKWPRTKLFVLTNGRALKDFSYVEQIFNVRNRESIGFGIPLYADAASVHDAVVGVEGAFGQTIKALLNLALFHAEIEIRFVVSRLSYKRLPSLVAFIGKNLPFVSRIAVMGLEPMGYCRENWNEFWIDPQDCRKELLDAARCADNHNINLFIYNMQLCCLPKELHKIACSSISEWKRVYIPKCEACSMRSKCGGFFASQNEQKFLPRVFAV